MLIPVRCFTCGTSIGQHWLSYVESQRKSEEFSVFCSRSNLKRYCCRRMLLAHVDVARDIVEYPFVDTKAHSSHFKCLVTDSKVVACD